MRKGFMQVGLVTLMLVVTAGVARSQDVTPVATAYPAPARHRRLQLAVSFLPMSLGDFKSSYGGMAVDLDAAFAPGVAVSVGYEIVQGLTLGLAPQLLFNVKPKEDPITTNPAAARELDAMVRIAYAYHLVDTIAVFGEVLPGFSLIQPKTGDLAKGPVVAFGVGFIMDLSDRMFVSLAGGRQWGFQTRTDTARFMMDGVEIVKMVKTDVSFTYWRAALSVGARF
jgi:hypothetical protein